MHIHIYIYIYIYIYSYRNNIWQCRRWPQSAVGHPYCYYYYYY